MKNRTPEELIAIIKAKLDEVLSRYGIDKTALFQNGVTLYMNGNDGTAFDWEANDRLCEFMRFHPNEYGAVKLLLDKNGNVTIYIYADDKNVFNVTSEEKVDGFATVKETKKLRDWLIAERDDKDIWDAEI